MLRHGMPHYENNYARRGPPILSANVTREWSDRGRLTWTHLAMIREMWKGPLIVKGILHVDDARRAAKPAPTASSCRITAAASSTARSLRSACCRRCRRVPGYPVMLDGGVRRGTDVLKALALGASFVWIGRPFLYAASIGGHDGVRHAIELMRAEIERDMMMLGSAHSTSLAACREASGRNRRRTAARRIARDCSDPITGKITRRHRSPVRNTGRRVAAPSLAGH
jgi:L-lactate dehydrogenase (cytochrome)